MDYNDECLCDCSCNCQDCISRADVLTNSVVLDASHAARQIEWSLRKGQVPPVDAVYDAASYVLKVSGISPHHLCPARWDILWACITALREAERCAHARQVPEADAISEAIMSLSPNYALHSLLLPPKEIDILQEREDWEADYAFRWRDAWWDMTRVSGEVA